MRNSGIKRYVRFDVLLMGLLALTLLAACGGGGDDNNSNLVDNEPPSGTTGRGTLKSATKLTTHARSDLNVSNSDFSTQPQNVFLYDVDLYKLVYTTLDINGELIDASGLLALPRKNPQLASPLLSYQHGSIFYNAEAPTNDLSTSAPPALLASLGYITVAADYVGYGESHGAVHPYLLKEQSAAVVIDLLLAAQAWLEQQAIALNQQLFITGYSQGGYVTMAAHEALEQQDYPSLSVTAALPAAGPYHLGETLGGLLDQIGLRETNETGLKLPSAQQRSLTELLTDLVLGQTIPDDSDIVFDDTIISSYISDGADGVEAHNVNDWRATVPVRLFHGRDDRTVPFASARATLSSMQSRNSTDVQLIECMVSPAGHRECIEPYGLLLIEYFGGIAQGL